jgi:selenide, water dikinase
VLRPIQGLFDPADYPDLLVGLNEPDDAAVWRLSDDRALVVTTDFFTPVVDDPYDYGAIAAANALSDVYAMGGLPFLALNVAALPPDLPAEIGAEIIRGGVEKVREAGAVLAGGHTIQDQEPKFGLMVLGFVHPERLITKRGARPGDILVMSKPLGFGTITTALKRDLAESADVAEAVAWMTRLNRVASQAACQVGVRSGTDVTGFSLLGHAFEMAQASGVRLRFFFDKIPVLGGAKRYAAEWIFPGGAGDNRLYYGAHVHFASSIDEPSQMLLFDPQTSGGLLLATPPDKLDDLVLSAETQQQPLWIVGDVKEGDVSIEVI